MPKIEWVGSPNFSERQGRIPIAIVNHITSGLYPGCLTWMQNPKAQASSTYLVLKDGRILQLVSEYKKAWANGGANKSNWKLYDGTNPNLYTISIEHESLGEGLTEEQYQSTLWLHKEIIRDWNIPVDTDHIIGHYRIDSVNRPNCPGINFPWDRLFKDLKGASAMDKCVVFFSSGDYSEALAVANQLGFVAMFCRNGKPTVHPDAMKAKQVFNIGGPKLGHPNEVYMSGNTALDTLVAVADAYKGGKIV